MAGLITLLSIFVVAVLWRRMGAIADPGLILLLTVAGRDLPRGRHGGHAERLLEQARFSGRAVEEGWRLRKGGGRIRAKTTLLVMRNSQGAQVGSLMVMHDLTFATDSQDLSRKT